MSSVCWWLARRTAFRVMREPHDDYHLSVARSRAGVLIHSRFVLEWDFRVSAARNMRTAAWLSLMLLLRPRQRRRGLPGCRQECKRRRRWRRPCFHLRRPSRPWWVAPSDGAQDISPASRVAAAVLDGTITGVSVVDDYGKAVDGVVSPDKRSW